MPSGWTNFPGRGGSTLRKPLRWACPRDRFGGGSKKGEERGGRREEGTASPGDRTEAEGEELWLFWRRPAQESGLPRFFRGVDLLVFDGTYSEEFADKAKEYLHSTVAEAAALAAEARVGRLVLTHVSARINDSALLLSQASKRFKKVEVGSETQELRDHSYGMNVSVV